jgi:tetratricopeptide (TPR) repeat protein
MLFLQEACIVFDSEEGKGPGGRLERLQRALSGSEPHLLVLDGLERVQSVGKLGRTRGDLEDHRLKNLLRSIAHGLGRTRALITSRFKLTDLEQWERAGYFSLQLDELDKKSAVSVLKAWKVNGNEKQLLALAESVGRHALSVSVLGSYLNHFCGGDPKGAEEFNLEEISEDEPRAAKLGRILAGYAKNLLPEERDLLIRLSVFPKGVSVDVLGYLVDAGGEIAGALVGFKQVKLIRLAERLYKLGMVYTYKLQNKITYTAHPFLREYFRKLLGVPSEKIHEVIRNKLSVGLDNRPDIKPRESEILDRYETLIEHSILADRIQEAYDLYKNVMGGEAGQDHLYHYLCDYGRMTRILSLFAKDGEPQKLSSQIPLSDRAHLIGGWGLAIHALGDLRTAERCFDLQCKFLQLNEDIRNLAQALQNRGWTAMTMGVFTLAQKFQKESLKLAETDWVRSNSYSHLAYTSHALGKIQEAQNNFIRASEKRGKPLFSLSGFYEAEHLFAIGNKKKAYERTVENLNACEYGNLLRDIALCHILLGFLCLPDSIAKAHSYLKKVRDWTAQSGHMGCIIRAHILASEIAYCAGDLQSALSEANIGLNHAEGCGYGKFAIDLHIQLAKINLAIPDPRTVLRHARTALDRSEHPDCCYAWGQANAGHLCGVCHKDLSEPKLAKKRLQAALAIRKKIQHPGAKDTEKLLNEITLGYITSYV